MINTLKNSFKVYFAQDANTFIYFLQRIPLIGKRVPETLYKHSNLKLFLGIISQVIELLKAFVYKSLYLGFLIILPSFLLGSYTFQSIEVFLHIFFFLSFVLGSLMDTTILHQHNKPAFDMIILMRADTKEYYLSQILLKRFEMAAQLILPLIITGLIIGFSPLRALMLLLQLTVFRIIGEGFHLYIYDRTGKIFLNNGYLTSAVLLASLGLAYGLPLSGHVINLQTIIFNGFSVIILLFIGMPILAYLWKYNNYTPIAKSMLTKDNVFEIESILSEIHFLDVKLDEEKLLKEISNTKIIEDQEGYEYLNSLFFLRFRSILIRPIKTRVTIIGVIFLIILLVQFFYPESKVPIVEAIKGSSPIMVIIMYLLSTGERITKAMFYNCDVSLLRYNFYRDRNALLSNFTLRLKKVVFLNIIPASAIILVFMVLVITSGFAAELFRLVPLFLSILSLACFFSIHHLFMYYTIQPYTIQLEIKSPLFKFINLVVWLISYISMQIKTDSVYFTLGVLTITILYMTVAMIITHRVAPRTFRLK